MATPRVILITGASGGIGRSCAVHLSKTFPSAGDDRPLVLVLSGRRQGELEATAKECKEGTTTEIIVGDVSKEEDVASMFRTVKEKYGRCDVVFNVSSFPIAEETRGIWETSIVGENETVVKREGLSED